MKEMTIGSQLSVQQTVDLDIDGLLLARGRAGSIELHAADECASAPRSSHNWINLYTTRWQATRAM